MCASRHPLAPHAHLLPFSCTITWPMWPAFPVRPISNFSSAIIPAPTPVDTNTDIMIEGTVFIFFSRLLQCSASTSAFASFSRTTSSPTSSCISETREKSRHSGICKGDTTPSSTRIGPPQPTPHASRRTLFAEVHANAPETCLASDSHTCVVGVEIRDSYTTVRAVFTTPTEIFVPPMSTAKYASFDAVLKDTVATP